MIAKELDEILERVKTGMTTGSDADTLRELFVDAAIESANVDFFMDGRTRIFELLTDIKDREDNFDSPDYWQGKKDGLRSALALIGYPKLETINRPPGAR